MDGIDLPPPSTQPAQARGRLMALFGVAVVASLVLPRIPYGRYLVYPFALLGTWAHEMGHGLMAIVLGGSFERLELYQNLGGVAVHSGLGSLSGVLVSAAGLLGPAVFGAVVIIFGSRPSSARWVLGGLSIIVLLSVVLFVRNGFGIIAMTIIGLVLGALGFYGPELVRLALTQLVGVQFCLASWGTLDYMFTQNFRRDGELVDSDTQNIADVLLLPYWFWGGVVAVLSALIMAFAFHRAWIRPYRRTEAAPITP